MATLQEALRIKKEKGLSTRDAIAQVEGNVGTQVTPQPTVNKPPNPNPPQTMQGVNGETFQVAPTNQQTELSQPPVQTPQPQTPTTLTNPQAPITTSPTEVKPPEAIKPVKTEAPIDYNTSQGRESEIQANVTNLTKTNPALLKDRNAFNQAFGYDTADQGKKAILDASFSGNQPTQPTVSSMYTAISSKAEIPLEQKNTSAYRVANNRYQRANQYMTMTPSEINQAFTSGALIEGSQTFDDLKAMNPKLAQDAINLRKVNGNKTNIWTYTNNPDGTPVKTNNLEKQFANEYEEDYPDIIEQLKAVYQTPTYDEMMSKINTQEVKDIQTKATAIETELNDLTTTMESIDSDVEAELKGTGATASRIALEKSARNSKLQKVYDARLRDYTTQYNKANNLINQNTEIFKYTQEQNKAKQTAIAGVYMSQYENQQSRDNMVFQADLGLQTKQAEFEQGIEQQAQLANDPVTGVKNIMATFAKMGIFADRSEAEIIQDVQNKVANGKTVGQALSELTAGFKSKPEYQKALELNMGQLSDAQKMSMLFNQDIAKIKLQDSMKDKNIQRVGGTNENPIYGYIDGNRVVTVSVPGSTTGVSATGNIVPVQAGNKTVRLDQSGASGFENAISQLKAQGLDIVVGEGARDQTATIKSMAERYGIPFNASNPAETAQKLRSAGHQVADPGKSNHESGMAIDVYANGNFDAVTPEQEKILNANGWYSAGIPGDAGHFEYRGGGQGSQGADIKMQALSLVQGLGGTADERKAFADNVIKVSQRDNISLAEAKKKLGYKSADDTEFAKARGAEFKTIKSDTRDKLSNANTTLTLLNSPQTAIGDVASVVGFLKTIDPASVARESEVAAVENARGVIDSLSNVFAKAKEGTKLTDSQRKQLKDSIQTIVNAGNAKYNQYITETVQEFNDRGLDPTVYISKSEIERTKGNTTTPTYTPEQLKEKALELYTAYKNR